MEQQGSKTEYPITRKLWVEERQQGVAVAEVVIEMVKCGCVKQQCSTNRCQCRKARLTCTKFAHALMMTSPVKILCRKMMVMNALMKMMKVTITMIIQVMMMNTINVFIELCLYHTFKGRLITV